MVWHILIGALQCFVCVLSRETNPVHKNREGAPCALDRLELYT